LGTWEIRLHPVLLGLEYHLGLVEKQSKRIEELARFLPFADQQKEMEGMAADLNVAAEYIKRWIKSNVTGELHSTWTERSGS
jgi:hypothetical protein